MDIFRTSRVIIYTGKTKEEYVTHDFIAKEGREMDQQLQKEIIGGDLNKSFDLGHQPIA